MSQKLYIVKRSSEERMRLEGMLQKGWHPTASLAKITILLKADVDQLDGGWAQAQRNQSHEMCKIFVEEGLEHVLTRKKREIPPTPEKPKAAMGVCQNEDTRDWRVPPAHPTESGFF